MCGKLCYTGTWKNDLQHGKGQENYPDGSFYNGDFKDGFKSGFGQFKWRHAEYNGQFLDDMRDGTYGKMVWNDGRIYEGSWLKDKM